MRPSGSPRQLEKRCRRAIQLLEKGMTLSAVAQQVGSSISSVFRWQQAFQKEGEKKLGETWGHPLKGTCHYLVSLASLVSKQKVWGQS